MFGNGSGGESVFNGKKFKDEKGGLSLKHHSAGVGKYYACCCCCGCCCSCAVIGVVLEPECFNASVFIVLSFLFVWYRSVYHFRLRFFFELLLLLFCLMQSQQIRLQLQLLLLLLLLNNTLVKVLSMGNSGKNANTSQFFVTLAPCPQLDGE